MQAANTVVKIAKLSVMDTPIHVAPSDVDVGFAATDTLTKAANENRLGIDGILPALYNLFPYSPVKRTIKSLLDQKCFHCLLVELDGLKTRRWHTELFKYGPTLLDMLMKPCRVKFQHQVTLPKSDQLYRIAS